MDVARNLGEVFDELTIAGSQDVCVQIAARAAAALTGAFGVCLLSANGEDSLLALASRPQLYLCDLRSSGLYHAATALERSAERSRTLWGRDDFVTLPTGQQRRVRMALIVLMQASDHRAVGFLWQPGQVMDPQHAGTLELLARALDLAIRNWRRDEDNAARRRLSEDVQHRLRNNLALVRSVVRRSHETAESAEDFALHLQARISALTRIQGALANAGAAGVDLQDLIHTELVASAAGERCSLHGPAVRLHDQAAALLALVVHELATNSLKFGALAEPAARLAINWSVTRGAVPHLHLSWSEGGVTIACSAPRRRGFGQELIECTLPYELGAHTRMTFKPGGINCEINIPLEAFASVDDAAEPSSAQGASQW